MQPKERDGAGLRDFRLFNHALLARQAWSLLSRLESLCVQILKATYYLEGKLEDTLFSANTLSSCRLLVMISIF